MSLLRIGGSPDDATRLHWDSEVGAIWLDTDVDETDGLVIGVGESLAEAIADATIELRDRLADLASALVGLP